MSEAVRNLIRIIANFIRSIFGMIIGLLFVRLMLLSVGDEGLGLVIFLVSTSSIGSFVIEIMQLSMTRELGVAHHSGDRQQFIEVFNAAWVLCLIGAVFITAIYIALFFVLPWFDIPDHLLNAARWLVVAKGLELVAIMVMMPQLNMFMIKEKMIYFNLWMLGQRISMALPSVFMVYFLALGQVNGIKFYAVSSSLLMGLTAAAFTMIMVTQDRRTLPRPFQATRQGFQTCLAIGKWNLAVITSINIHERLSQIFMNLWFGVIGNMIYGFALQLSSYLRTLVQTVTFGVDAVAARMSAKGAERHLQLLMSHSTRVHGFVAFPAFLSVWILAEPLITVWVGAQMQDPQTNIPPTVLLIRIISIGIVARAISDGWMRILYGAGHIKKYAPMILLGGLANPIICCLLYYFILPESIKYTTTAWPLMLIFLIIHMGALPIIGAPLLDMKKRDLLWPLWRPLLVSMLCTPVLWYLRYNVQNWNLITLFASVIFYGCVYCLFAWFLILNREERNRIFQALKRKLSRKYESQPDPTGQSED